VADPLADLEIAELADRFFEETVARQLLAAAGISRGEQPVWSATPRVFWGEVSAQLAGGKLPGGRLRILAEACRQFPANAVFRQAGSPATPVSDASRATVPAAGPSTNDSRRPWMVPPLDRMIVRPELGDRLLEQITSSGGGVALSTAVRGAGGFGKTQLATWLGHQREVRNRFTGGLLWVTLGEHVRERDLAARVNNLTWMLSREHPGCSDPIDAGYALASELDRHEPTLLVVDDVWSDSQLLPFRSGGDRCTRLITTRINDLLPAGYLRIDVDAMTLDQATSLVGDGLPGLDAADAAGLAEATSCWPLLLNNINGVLRKKIDQGLTPKDAARWVSHRLDAAGPTAFDPTRAAERSRGVAATMGASLEVLDHADRRRYRDLAIFPEDVDIPVAILDLMWPGRDAETLCDELLDVGLVSRLRVDGLGARIQVHDVIRAYLRAGQDQPSLAATHSRLVDAAAGLLPDSGSASGEWWTLPDEAAYLWRHLPYHLAGAGRGAELAATVCDPRWIEGKSRRFGSSVEAESDLTLADTKTARTLHRVLSQSSHMFGPIEPASALGVTLASRINIPELRDELAAYQAVLPTPRLDPVDPFRDYPDPALHRTLAGHASKVLAVTFSPDGTTLASASRDGAIRLWDVASGAERTRLPGKIMSVWGLLFLPDGTSLLAVGSRGGQVWNTTTSTLRGELCGHSGAITSCAIAPDQNLIVTTGGDRTARLWHLPDLSPGPVLPTDRPIVTAGFFQESENVVTVDTATIKRWDIATGASTAIFQRRDEAHENQGGAISLTGTVATTHGSLIRLHPKLIDSSRVGESVAIPLLGHVDRVRFCAFSPDETRLATAGADQTVRLWDTATGQLTAIISGHAGAVYSCAFSRSGTMIATASADSMVRLWHLDRVNQHGRRDTQRWYRSCTFSTDGRTLAATSDDGTVHLLDTGTSREISRLESDSPHFLFHCAYSPDGTHVVAAAGDGIAHLWRTVDGKRVTLPIHHSDRTSTVAFSVDGRLVVSGSLDGTIQVCDLSTGRIIFNAQEEAEVRACGFMPDGRILVVATGVGRLRLFETSGFTVSQEILEHRRGVNALAFHPTSPLLATASSDHTLRIFSTATGAQVTELSGHHGAVRSCAFSPTGDLLLSASADHTLRVWNVATSQCVAAIRVAQPLHGCAWHPHSNRVAAVGVGGIYQLQYQT